MFIFLDRDGVLNRRIPDDYVRNISQWEWLPLAKEAVIALSSYATRIFIVSNQQGVGKGLFTLSELEEVTAYFLSDITNGGGKVTKVYYCTHLASDNCTCRKPQIGMALQAQKDFPEVDFSQSLMIGDSYSDLVFGRNAGMEIYLVTHENNLSPNQIALVEKKHPSLYDFAQEWIGKQPPTIG